MKYQDKLLWLADRLRDESNPHDQGLAAQMLMARLKRSEKLDRLSYTIQ